MLKLLTLLDQFFCGVRLRYIRWSCLLARHSLPVDTFKELVLHNVANLKPHLWVRNKNLTDQVSSQRIQVLREDHASRVDYLDDLLGMHGHECASWVPALELSLSGSYLHGFRSEGSKPSEDLTH